MGRRMVAALVVASGLVVGACGVSHDAKDMGVADEPTRVGIVACASSTDDNTYLRALDQLRGDEIDTLLSRCDYRRTHEHCEEDEVCAVQQMNDTGDFAR